MIPVRIIVSGLASRMCVTPRMMSVAARLAAKAQMVMRYGLSINTASAVLLRMVPAPKNTTAMAAPKAAALEMPSVKGEPSGFLKMLCMAAPATDSAMPARMADSTRGSLMFQMICRVSSFVSPKKTPKTRVISRSAAPKLIPITANRTSRTEAMARKSLLRSNCF